MESGWGVGGKCMWLQPPAAAQGPRADFLRARPWAQCAGARAAARGVHREGDAAGETTWLAWWRVRAPSTAVCDVHPASSASHHGNTSCGAAMSRTLLGVKI